MTQVEQKQIIRVIKQQIKQYQIISQIKQCLCDSDLMEISSNNINSTQSYTNNVLMMHQYRNCLKQTKSNIYQIFQNQFQNMNEDIFRSRYDFYVDIEKSLRIFKSSQQCLLQSGILNLYLNVSLKYKRYSELGNLYQKLSCGHIQQQLQELLKYYAILKQIQRYSKKNWWISQPHDNTYSKTTKHIQTPFQLKIRHKYFSKTCDQIIEQYVKKQQLKITQQTCRICFKQINMKQIKAHMQYCSKKRNLQQQINKNIQNRQKCIEQLKVIIDQQEQSDDTNIIRQLISFYQSNNIAKTDKRRRRRSSVTHLDQKNNINLSLFFMKRQASLIQHPNCSIDKLLTMLKQLQDKAYCLNKKVQVISDKDKYNNIAYNYSDYISSQTIGFKRRNSRTLTNTIYSKQASESDSDNASSKSSQQSNQQDNELPTVIPKLKNKYSVWQTRRESQQSNLSDQQPQKITLQKFDILNFLGKGAFSRVYLVRKRKTQDLYALKLTKINNYQKQREGLTNQYRIYKKIEGKHLVAAPYCFQQNSGIFFVLQYMCGGDLSKILEQNVYLQQKQAKFYLAELVLAIEHLHKFNIVHRDIKPENIVLDTKGHIKLTDFGLSQMKIKKKFAEEFEKIQMSSPTTPLKKEKWSNKKSSMAREKSNTGKLIGTPDYIAPQIIKGQSYDNATVDWWSLGVIAYQMIIGCRPFSACTIQQIIDNILTGFIQFPQIGYEEDMISPQAADLIKKLLNPNYEQRIGFKGGQEIKKHQFFKDIEWEVIKQCDPPFRKNIRKRSSDFLLCQNDQLRSQINQLIKDQQNSPHKLQLQSYARYDLLTDMNSVEESLNSKKQRLAKIKDLISQKIAA